MENDDNKEYMKAQINEIEKYKWIESEKAKRDLGESAVKDWIKKFAKIFRDSWNKRKHNDN